jgi:hypothetical protein
MKAIFTSLLLISVLSGFAQEEEAAQDTTKVPIIGTKEYYLQKSVTQRKNGIFLLVGGTGLIIGGIIAGESGTDKPGDLGFGPSFETGVTLLVIGLLADLASIPCFAAAAKNAQRAAQIKERDNENMNSFENSGIHRRPRKSIRVHAEEEAARYEPTSPSASFSNGFSHSIISGY